MRKLRSWFTVYLGVLAVLLVTAGPTFAMMCSDTMSGSTEGESCYDCSHPDMCGCEFWLNYSTCGWPYPGTCHLHWQVALQEVEGLPGGCVHWLGECMWLNWHCYWA